MKQYKCQILYHNRNIYFILFVIFFTSISLGTTVSGYDSNRKNNTFDKGPKAVATKDELDTDSSLMLKAYKESYITRDTAKKFVDKIKNYRDTHTKDQYNKFLDDIAFKPIALKEEKHSFFNKKKYFDYLPTDEKKSKSTSDDSTIGSSELGELPPDIYDKENLSPTKKSRKATHRRSKRQLINAPPGYYYSIPHPERYYLPVPPPRYPDEMYPSIGNRIGFDLASDLIFDYQYEPARAVVAKPASNVPFRPSTTIRPVFAQRPAVGQRPVPPSSIYFPTEQPQYTTTTVRTTPFTTRAPDSRPKATTTQAPSIFHSSDYDDDLEQRIGIDKREPHKCTWAIVNCCGSNNAVKRNRCFSIFGCARLQQSPYESCSSQNMRQAIYERDVFLNSSYKK